MANKQFNIRLQSKYDTYASWQANDPVLLAGEIAVVVVPAATNAVAQEPAILFKVGDGVKKFSELGFTSAIAGDVYDWAKAATKPAYAASEIEGLGAAIESYVQNDMGISIDTDTQYKVEALEDGMGFVLYSKEKAAVSWTEVSTIDFEEKFIKSIATGSVNGTIAVDGANVAVKGLGSAAFTEASAYEVAGAAKAVEDKLAEESARAKAAEKANADAIYAIEADYLKAVDKTELENKIGEVPADKTVVQMIADSEYDDSLIKADIKANSDAIRVLNGDAEGSVNKKITDAFNDFATKVSDDAVVNSYKELIDYAAAHGAEFTTLSGVVADNTTAISTEKARAEGVEAGLDERLKEVEAYDHAADIKEAKDYADGLAINYDVVGAAATVKTEVLADLVTAKTELQTAIDEKVDAVEDSRLITNDEASKLEAIEAGAQVNVIESIKVNGEAVSIVDKAVDIVIKNDIADLEQAEGYIIFNCGSSSVNI